MEQNFRNRFCYFIKNTNKNHTTHQEEGVVWCGLHEHQKQPHQNIHGGIIADEMGCGKTLMTIALMMCNFVDRTLIVVPRPLLDQWKRSIFELTGHHAFIYYGNLHLAEKNMNLYNCPIVITTYGVISHNNTNKLFNIKWDRIIYDEAHHMRNASTQKHIAGLLLKSKIKWLITGTPIQNRESDLYNLCKIIGIPNAKKIPVEILQKNILKRTKLEVGIKLPDVLLNYYNIEWANNQEKLLATVLHDKIKIQKTNKILPVESDEKTYNFNKIEDYIDSEPEDICNDITDIAESKSNCKNENEYLPHLSDEEIKDDLSNYVDHIFGQHYLAYYLRCKQMCTYPRLLNKLEKNSEVVSSGLINKNKINKVISVIESRANNNNNKIIFCSFRKEMDIIQQRLQEQGIYDVEIYDGRISQNKRNQLLKQLPHVLILQIQMGCEGLNLQEANEIYFVSPIWNPAMESQAIARCYRIGQTKKTHVFKFNMNDIGEEEKSMDNYMNVVLKNKKQIQELI